MSIGRVCQQLEVCEFLRGVGQLGQVDARLLVLGGQNDGGARSIYSADRADASQNLLEFLARGRADLDEVAVLARDAVELSDPRLLANAGDDGFVHRGIATP